MGERGFSDRGIPRKALSRGQGGVWRVFAPLAVSWIPLGGVGRFQSRFSVGVVGQEFRVGLRVTQRFWQQHVGGSFNGGPLLLRWVWLFLYDFRGCGFWFRGDDRRGGSDGHGSNGGLVGLGHQ
jgi:hypothetical protein